LAVAVSCEGTARDLRTDGESNGVAGSSRQPPLRVLFIGNSYTYGNDLPALVAALAEAAGGRRVDAATCVRGGFTLEQHAARRETLAELDRQDWDVVVLQEQSTRPVVDPKRMHAFARKLHEQIRSRNARTVFFLTWARQHKPEMQAGLNRAYFSIAKELGATVAPVGVAWQQALSADAKLVLHTKDQSHPNPAGSYLAACVFYATLLDKSPVGLPGQLSKGEKTLLSLDNQCARRLQEIAWSAVCETAKGTAVASGEGG